LVGHVEFSWAARAAGSTAGTNVRAWLPWTFLTVFVAASTILPIKNVLNATFAPKFAVPGRLISASSMAPVFQSRTAVTRRSPSCWTGMR